MASSIAATSELLDTLRTTSFCCASRVDSCADGMLGCAGNEASIAAVSLDLATDEGSVSGSKSAFKMRASFADRVVLGTSIAMVCTKEL